MTDVSPNFPTGDIANPDASAAIDAESERTPFDIPDVRPSDTYRWDVPSTKQTPQEPEVAPDVASADTGVQLDIFGELIADEEPIKDVSVTGAMLVAMAVSNEFKARNIAAAAASGRIPTTAETQSTISKDAATKFLRHKYSKASKRDN